MLVFIDTEFTGFETKDLISLGAVTSDGQEFYVEISDFKRENASSFVEETVIPLLDLPRHGKPFEEAKAAFKAWLSKQEQPVLVCDHGIDLKVLEFFVEPALLTSAIVLPYMHQEHLLLLSEKGHDVMALVESYEDMLASVRERHLEACGGQVHHALTDAQRNRQCHLQFELQFMKTDI